MTATAPSEPTQPATPAPAQAAKRPRRRPWRLLAAWLAGTVVLVLAAAGAALWWTWSHPAALPWLLQHVPGLSVQGVQGTLQRGTLHIESLELQLPADLGRLRASGLRTEGLAVRLRPRPGVQAAVSLRSLQIDRLQFNSGAPSGQPLQAPADLHLPLDLLIEQLRIGEARIDQQAPLRQVQAALALGADGGRLHRLDHASGVLELGSADTPAPLPWQAELQIGSGAPLPVQATLALQRAATDRSPAWHATLTGNGPLARLDTTLQLASQLPAGPARPGAAAPTLQARATVLPFAPWPLADLVLQTEALDLAALSPHWPQTRLAGRADVKTSGLAQAASVAAQLSNSLPGAWDLGRVPVRTLDLVASGNPSQTDRLTLDRFDLQLGAAAGEAGAAGRISGQGWWRGDALALDLRLDALRPARLHRRAADLVLSGPVQLHATGLPMAQARSAPTAAASAPGVTPASAPSARPASSATPAPSATSAPAAPPARGARAAPAEPPAALPQLAVVAQLSGRLLDGTGGPVQLQLKGDVSQRHLRLLQVDATAGAARASGTLDARAVATGWQLRGQVALQDFDPRPWWRGAERSVWRRGPHRVSASLDAKLLWQHAASQALAADTQALDRLLAAVDGQATLQIGNSLLAGVPVSGRLDLRSNGPVAEVDGRLNLAGNQLRLIGHGGGAPAADEWQLGLEAPALAALAPLGAMLAELVPAAADAWPRAGRLNASLKTSGRWPAMRIQGEAAATGLSTALGSLQNGTLSLRTGGSADAPLTLQLRAQGLARGAQRLDRVEADVNGSPRDHRLRLLVDSPVRPPAWSEALLGPAGSGTRFESEARGGWTAPGGVAGSTAGQPGGSTGGGSYQLQAMALKAGARDAQGGSRPWLAAQGLAGALVLDAAGQLQSLQAEPGRVQLLETALNWSQLQWRADGGAGRLDVVAQLETIAVAPLLARLQPDLGWGGTLTIGGQIDIHSAKRFDADVVLERIAGDLNVTDELGETQALGLSDLRLALSAHDGLWQIAQGLAGRRIGTVVGAQVLRSTPERRWPGADAPLQGVLEARVANLGVWGAWLPPGWRLSGRLDTEAQFSGTLGAADINGSVRGTDLGLRNLLQGVSLTDGQLNLVLAGDTARIERFSFQGGDGRLDLSGSAVLGAEPTATLRLAADKFRMLGRIDRRVVVSGDTVLKLDRKRLQLDGALTIDEGLIDISRTGAPSLDDDVVVSRGPASGGGGGPANGGAQQGTAATAVAAPLRNAQVNIKLGLGQNLRLRGQGVDTLLRGDLALTSPGGRLALNGTVRTHEGLYAAYGQKLEIARGNFFFTGSLDSPRLDVLALRPNLDVEAGVSIVGSASNPRIRLYSNPDMADYDKLSWLVMGRASEGLGTADAALLQRAAISLLAGDSVGPTDQMLSALGLTEFSVKQTEGATRDTVVSLGKQLSRRWWVGYERGVHATTGTWQVIYRVAQRFTLRAQSGEQNALDVIWTWRW